MLHLKIFRNKYLHAKYLEHFLFIEFLCLSLSLGHDWVQVGFLCSCRYHVLHWQSKLLTKNCCLQKVLGKREIEKE